MTTWSHREKAIAEKGMCIVFIQAESEDGRPAFAYITVYPTKLDALMSALQSEEAVDICKYGHVLLAGYRELKPAHREKVNPNYLFNERATNLFIKPSS